MAININIGGNRHHDRSHHVVENHSLGHHNSYLHHGYDPYAFSHSRYSSYSPYYGSNYYCDVNPYYYNGRSGFSLGARLGGLSLGYSNYNRGYDIYPGFCDYGSGFGYSSSSYIYDPYSCSPSTYWSSYRAPAYYPTYGPVYTEPFYFDDTEALFDIDFYEPLYWDDARFWGLDYYDGGTSSAWIGSYSADPFIHYSFANSFACY